MSQPTTGAPSPAPQPAGTLQAGELRRVSTFADLPEAELEWLASMMQEVVLPPGEVFLREGSPANQMVVVLEGELRARQESVAGSPVFVIGQYEISGMLPYSRMQQFPATVRAVTPTRLACLGTEHFPAMLQRLPVLAQRLVGIMSDRIRDVTREDVQRDKLMALGKLSAGLAHELNNPAAAIARTVESLRRELSVLRQANEDVRQANLTPEHYEQLKQCELAACEHVRSRPALDTLARSDREEAFGALLERQGVQEPWHLAPLLVDAGTTEEDVACLTRQLPRQALSPVLVRLTSTLTAERLLEEIAHGASRISELVRSVKEYSFMDQAPVQPVDLHRGLENTLTMLQHRLKQNVRVTREYDSTISPVLAHGSELNQVWTNLIDNALDAMPSGGALRIRTVRELDQARVEIADTGTGIPEEIRARVFEPFFTTKGVGEGTGLGLDAVYRIVRKHQGEVHFETSPSGTTFHVRLPLQPSPQ